LFRSPVSLTPYQSEERIDDVRLRAIIDEAYRAADLDPKDIDTGVVILTGEALRRDNAQAIGALLAAQGGDFVCATAGHHMEAMLAAYGSGAARASSDRGQRILNIDIGGGTTKLALIEAGRAVKTAAIHIGGRLQVVDAEGRIVRLDPAGQHHAARAGFHWRKGDHASAGDLDKVAAYMADALVAAIRMRPLPPPLAALYLTEPIDDLGRIDGIMLSGGVGEYVYRREDRDFGDLGQRLGLALRARIDAGALPWPLLPAGECIRATALGASEYSVQLSGNTSTITDPAALLPRRNLQVLQPQFACGEVINPETFAAAIRGHFTAFDLTDGEHQVALALRWQGAPSHERIHAFAEGIVRALPRTIAMKKPLYIMLDGDIAQTLGLILREELGVQSEILCIDGVVLWDFDYIDLGRIRVPSMTVPVTIKSLVFSEDPRLPRGQAHLQHHQHHHLHHHHDHDHRPGHDHPHTHGHDHGQHSHD
jgi:ethanolamine utilization protein EutA